MSATTSLPGPSLDDEDEIEKSRAPITEHLTELRSRLIRSFSAIAIFSLIAYLFSKSVLNFLLQPIAEAAKSHGRALGQAVFTAPLELFFIQLKVSVFLGLMAAFPYVAYQLYAFVAPGLYKHERQSVAPFLIAVPPLFLAGAGMVFYFILPVVLNFSFQQEFKSAGAEVSYLPQVKPYYDLAIGMVMAFGLAFQLPVVLVLLIKAGVLSVASLRKARRYSIVGIFFAAMVLTPSPDPFSQILLAIPLCLLYEASIFCGGVIERARKRREAAEAVAAK